MPTPPIPARTDFTSGTELLVRISDGQRTDTLHTQFTAFWPDDAAPCGVRGQVFTTNWAGFVTREAAKGHTVRLLVDLDAAALTGPEGS